MTQQARLPRTSPKTPAKQNVPSAMSDCGTSALIQSAPGFIQPRTQRIRRVMVTKTVNDFMPTAECDRILGGIGGISVSETSMSQAHEFTEVTRLVGVSV